MFFCAVLVKKRAKTGNVDSGYNYLMLQMELICQIRTNRRKIVVLCFFGLQLTCCLRRNCWSSDSEDTSQLPQLSTLTDDGKVPPITCLQATWPQSETHLCQELVRGSPAAKWAHRNSHVLILMSSPRLCSQHHVSLFILGQQRISGHSVFERFFEFCLNLTSLNVENVDKKTNNMTLWNQTSFQFLFLYFYFLKDLGFFKSYNHKCEKTF